MVHNLLLVFIVLMRKLYHCKADQSTIRDGTQILKVTACQVENRNACINLFIIHEIPHLIITLRTFTCHCSLV